MRSVSAFNYPARADLLTTNGWTGNHANPNTYRWNAITSVDLGGTVYQAACFWNGSGNLVVGYRQLDAAWTLYTDAAAISGDDNHDVCAIGIDPDGYVHISYDMHNHALKYSKSTTIISSGISGFSAASMLGTNESSVTYPTFINDPAGNLYFIFRDGVSANGDLFMYKYTHGTTSWAAAAGTTAGKVIDGKGSSTDRSPYWDHPCFDSDFGSGGYFHLSWHWRVTGNTGGNEDLCYVRWDGTNWTKADGTSQTIPITDGNCETVDDTAGENLGKTGFNALYSDSAGNPHIVYPKTNTNRYIYHAYHNGTNWTISQITTTPNPSLGDNSGTDKGLHPAIAIDRSNNTVYVIYRDLFESEGIWMLKSTNFTTWTKKRIYPYSVGWWSPKFDYVEFERSGNIYIPIEEYYGALLDGNQSAFPIYVWKADPSTW